MTEPNDRAEKAESRRTSKPLLMTMGAVALLAVAGLIGSRYTASDSQPTEPSLPPSSQGEPDQSAVAPSATSTDGFQMGTLSSDEVIDKIKVTIKAGPGADITQTVDLHLGFGFPLRLNPLGGNALESEDPAPVFAAFPTASSLSTEALSAGETAWFQYSQSTPAPDHDPLRTSETLLADLKVADISQIGFAATGKADWSIAQYSIEVNGKLYARNQEFDRGPPPSDSEALGILSELLPKYDVLVQQIERLSSVIQSGLGSADDERQLAFGKLARDRLARSIQLIGGRELGHFPIMNELNSRFTPLLSRGQVSSIRVRLITDGQERSGTKNPIYLKAGGRKFLLASEVTPLGDDESEQIFELSPADLKYDPVARQDIQQFAVGVLGSNRPFDQTPDRAKLKRIIVESNGERAYDSELVDADKLSLERITLVPPAHRDGNGNAVINVADDQQRFLWRPGIVIAEGATATTGARPAEPPIGPPNLPPTGNLVGKAGGPGMGNGSPTPVPRFVPLRRQASGVPQNSTVNDLLLAVLLRDLVDRLNDNSVQTTPVADPDDGSGNGDGDQGVDADGDDEDDSGQADGGDSPAPKPNPNPDPKSPPEKLVIKNVGLTDYLRNALYPGNTVFIKWDVENADQVKEYQARLYAVLPHTNNQPVLVSESPRISSAISIGATTLPSIDLTKSGIAPSDQTKLFGYPQVVAFDSNDEVIQTAVPGTGPLVPLFNSYFAFRLPPGPHQTLYPFTGASPGWQSNAEGYDLPANQARNQVWHRFLPFSLPTDSREPVQRLAGVWRLDQPTNAHTTRTFDYFSQPLGVSTLDSQVESINVRFEALQKKMDANFRIVGHIGFINSPPQQQSEVQVEARVIIQDVPDGESPYGLAPIGTADHSKSHELLRIESSSAVSYLKSGEETPLALIDIPISLDQNFDAYQQSLGSLTESPIGASMAINDAYKQSLPLGRIENGFVSLTLKIKQMSGGDEETVGLFGLRLVEDPVQPSGGIPDKPGPTTPPKPPTTPPKTVSLEDFKILSYNAYLLQHPTPGADRRPERAAEIAKAGFMKGYDVVILNEMFDDAPSHQILDGLRDEYPYQTPTVGESTSDDWDRTVGDLSSSAAVIRGGVVIVSKWPITERIQYIYEQACGADDLANKGFAYTTIEYGDKQVHVIGTHVQAADADFFGNVLSSFGSLTTCSGISFLGIGSDPPDGYEAGWSERQSQFDELRQFLVNQNVPKEDLVLIGGDLNVPAHTPEYQWMLDKLGAVEPTGFQGHGSTYDPANNALIDDKNQPSVRLDYILISGDHYVPATWYNEVTQQSTSDHYPVAASMKATLPKATRNYNYKLSIKTGSKKGGFPFYEEQAGTDSNVKARLQGDDGSWSPWYVLDNDGNDFVANATDRYYLTTEIPSVRAIEFEKDSAGGGPDWYVESVSLKRVDGKSVSVTAKQWISKGNVTLVF